EDRSGNEGGDAGPTAGSVPLRCRARLVDVSHDAGCRCRERAFYAMRHIPPRVGMLCRHRRWGYSMNSSNIQSVLLEERSFAPPEDFTAHAVVTPAELEALHARAKADPVGFWADLA